uniref:Uncharacterized protein n=1 Tax=Aegilops tauschii subsp. strangulata TaxID=200361 RepID=A0A452YMJ4_AEGTS
PSSLFTLHRRWPCRLPRRRRRRLSRRSRTAEASSSGDLRHRRRPPRRCASDPSSGRGKRSRHASSPIHVSCILYSHTLVEITHTHTSNLFSPSTNRLECGDLTSILHEFRSDELYPCNHRSTSPVFDKKKNIAVLLIQSLKLGYWRCEL